MIDESTPKGREALHVTLRVNDRPVGDAVIEPGQSMNEGPVHVTAGRTKGTIVLRDATGERPVGRESVQLREGRVDIKASLVRRFRLARFIFEEANLVFPLVMAAVTVLGLQIMLLLSILSALFAGGGPPPPPEPSPEYLTRLLNGDYAGKEQGVVALKGERPTGTTEVESFYLPSGSAGPITKAGGGRRVGAKRRGDDARSQKGEAASIKIEELGKTENLVPQDQPDEPSIDDLADPLATPDGQQAEHLEAVEVEEGWGLTDWYDTEDARKDRQEITEAIDISNQLLKLDPDNLYGLSIKAYYQYLAMDFEGAELTYDHMLKIDGTGGAQWNNLALVYKRRGDYQKEEELYRTALMLDPNEPNTKINLALCYGHQGRFDEALEVMRQMEVEIPDDPYADLHRAKIYALMGNEAESYKFLEKSLKTMRKLDTLHNIEFQQDIRVDPAFKTMREAKRFKALLVRYYGKREGGWWDLESSGAAPMPGVEGVPAEAAPATPAAPEVSVPRPVAPAPLDVVPPG
ncbi:hypothetical protein LBMAG42_45280 [Deltaproteobacteria bacterium]|nr:hypothetical protein LBMAG42_45280 [Deltaproteobacteria bacterium]